MWRPERTADAVPNALDWSPTGRARVFAITFVGVLFCVAAALFVDSFNFRNLSSAELQRAISVNILVPTFLAGPLLFLLTSKMRQLAIAHREISIIAATDSLTAVMNRGAFTMLVDAFLERARQEVDQQRGALLIVDVDHFKSINDRYGHQQGDWALKEIAQAIKAQMRDADVVGRVGGEEFAIFLPGASAIHASSVAERIRKAIQVTTIVSLGDKETLSVSIGGSVFNAATSYDQLFKAADTLLYEAKAGGRNRIKVRPLANAA